MMNPNVHNIRQLYIGILTVHDESRKFRGNRQNFIDLIRTGKEVGINIFVVTQKDLQLDQPKIQAYVYDFERKRWKRESMPLPQVIYNRIPNRNDELRADVQKTIKECIKHPKIEIFNPLFFNKWTLFEWLKKSKLTKKHIPSTRKLSDKLDLRRLLHRHNLLYLKPEKGKAGKGIMRIKRHYSKSSPYQLTIQVKKTSRSYRYKSITGLKQTIKDYTESEDYIVQQGIVLAHYQQRPFDLRVLVQKNRNGKWSVSGVGARVAGDFSITTHLPRGGRIEEPETILTTAFGTTKAQHIMRKTRKTALAIARQVEKGSGQPLGEMSMDLGIDRRGQIWFFEANAKPMKFDEPHIRQKSLQQLLNYCVFLTQTRSSNKGKRPARKGGA